MSIDLKMIQLLDDKGFLNKDPRIGGTPVPVTAMPFFRVRPGRGDSRNVYADYMVLDWVRFDGNARLSLQGFVGTPQEPQTMTSLYSNSIAVAPATAIIDREMFRLLYAFEERVLDYGWGELRDPLQLGGSTVDQYLRGL